MATNSILAVSFEHSYNYKIDQILAWYIALMNYLVRIMVSRKRTEGTSWPTMQLHVNILIMHKPGPLHQILNSFSYTSPCML